MQVDDAASSAYSLHDKHYPQFQQAKDQYLKVVENKVADLRESGISGKVGQAADNAKKLPGIVNKRTEVALDRVEDVINQVASYPVGELSGREKWRSVDLQSGHFHCFSTPGGHSSSSTWVCCSSEGVDSGQAHRRLCLEEVPWHP